MFTPLPVRIVPNLSLNGPGGKNTVEILRLDLRKHENIQVQLEVPGTPSIFFYREGKLVQGITGAYETVGEYERFFRETGGAK